MEWHESGHSGRRRSKQCKGRLNFSSYKKGQEITKNIIDMKRQIFIHSLSSYLWSLYYFTSPVLGTGEAMENKIKF